MIRSDARKREAAQSPPPDDVEAHNHRGADWQCEACKPLADVLRCRMTWASMHWGNLHDDAFPSLARAVHESDWLAADRAQQRAEAERERDDLNDLLNASIQREKDVEAALARNCDALAELKAALGALADEWERDWLAGQVADTPITRIIRRRDAAATLRDLINGDTSALDKRLAKVWDEGYRAGFDNGDTGGHKAPNPYAARIESGGEE